MSCNKRKVLVLICLLIVIVLGAVFCCFLEAISQNREVIVNKTTNLMNSDTISMMYETWYQSGEYETTSDVSWPGEGYVFNETLSKCENGGTLSWDEASKKVLMASNRSDKCYIYFDREPEKLANYIKEYIYTTDGENGLYYHDGTGTYTNASEEAGDNSYRYSGGDYQVTEKAKQAGLNRLYTAVGTETDGVVNFYCNGSKQFVGANCGTLQEHYYTLAYNEGIHYSTLEEALAQAVSDGYLTSDNIKNYVCFGTDTTPCPEENLYRIIGVFDEKVKLIKYTYANSTYFGSDGDYGELSTDDVWSGVLKNASEFYRYYWNNSNGVDSINDWNSSRLNTVNLNTNYWNYLTAEWQSMISDTIWQIGGNTYDNIGLQIVKTVYTNEILSPTEDSKYQSKIGLMYVSDYMYAVGPDGWQNIGYESSATTDYQAIKGDNWMYMGLAEWAITKRTDSTNYSFLIDNDSTIDDRRVSTDLAFRPVFFLNSDVAFIGGSGTKTDPYLIM